MRRRTELRFQQLDWCTKLLSHHFLLNGLHLLQRTKTRCDEFLIMPIGHQGSPQLSRRFAHFHLLGVVIGFTFRRQIGLQLAIGKRMARSSAKDSL